MRFDTVIIGGGLSGLLCGIRLQKAGKKCAIISAGQSAMHFSSGTFDLLDRLPDGTPVAEPLKEMDSLPPAHPYKVLGKESVTKYAIEAPAFLEECGIRTTGSALKNSWRMTPTGERKATWLTINDFTSLSSEDECIGKKVLIANFQGYLDFNTKFIAASLEKHGSHCRCASIQMEEMERLRRNPSEMRATNIARVLDRADVLASAAAQIKMLIKDEDTVVLPAVFGLNDAEAPERLRKAIGTKVFLIATMPPSVPGIRSQMTLRAAFERAGGRFLAGDTVTDADYDGDGLVRSIGTYNLGDIRIMADHFVLASGSFFSKGLAATPDCIYEPVFRTDLIHTHGRDNWFNSNFFSKQEYISYGVSVDSCLRARIQGKTVDNLYAIGSVLGGANSLYEGCGGGIAIITAMAAADIIAGN